MEQIKIVFKSFIMMFSESIWMYYLIVMFTSVEWNQPIFFDCTWWIVSGALGYTLNALLANKKSHVLLFSANLSVLVFIIIQNWRNVVPQGSWIFGLAVSVGLSVVFIRSARLITRLPTRYEILRRFEGNVIYYIVFAVVFAVNKWNNEIFHLFFIFAIFSSLIGMILTLQGHEETEGDQKTKIMKVGQSGWFTIMVTVLLICIPPISLILLLPSVNSTLYLLGVRVWEGLKWLTLKIGVFLHWLLSLFPDPKMEGVIPSIPPEQTVIPHDAIEKSFATLSYIWLIAGVAIVLILIAIWFFTYFMKNRRFSKVLKAKNIKITRESWAVNMKKKWKVYLQNLNRRWRMAFPYFYHHPIYWNYHVLVKWGKKNGLPKKDTETTQEYVNKVIANIPESEMIFSYEGENYQLSELLSKLNSDYQRIYYGHKIEYSKKSIYKHLMKHLFRIRLKGI